LKPELKEEWTREKHNFFSSHSTEPVIFDGTEITMKQYDKRTPGKYKAEFIGEGMISLNSKVYHCWGAENSKTSCKGVRNETKRNETLSQKTIFSKNSKTLAVAMLCKIPGLSDTKMKYALIRKIKKGWNISTENGL